jgi:hypothetical protein
LSHVKSLSSSNPLTYFLSGNAYTYIA